MKTLIIKIAIVIVALLPATMLAQNSPVDKIFDKYSGMEGYTTVDVSKGLFELFSEVESDDEDFEDFQNAVEGIEKLRLLAYSPDDADSDKKEKFFNDLKKSIPFDEYDELMVVKDSDADIKFLAKSTKQVISEMLMLVDGNDEVVLLSLTGEINLNHVAKLGSTMKLGGMEHLGKMKKSK